MPGNIWGCDGQDIVKIINATTADALTVEEIAAELAATQQAVTSRLGQTFEKGLVDCEGRGPYHLEGDNRTRLTGRLQLYRMR